MNQILFFFSRFLSASDASQRPTLSFDHDSISNRNALATVQLTRLRIKRYMGLLGVDSIASGLRQEGPRLAAVVGALVDFRSEVRLYR